MSSKLHAVWPRTPATRLRVPAAADGRAPHVVELLGACAGLSASAALDVVYVHLPGGDDLFRLATRTGGRLGPTGCTPGVRMRAHGTPADENPAADLGVVTVGAELSAAEAKAAARLAGDLDCRRVMFVLPASSKAGNAAKAIAEACKTQMPLAIVEPGTFGPWSRQPDFLTVVFDAPPEYALSMPMAA
ncbi:MAG: hypothetical protein AB7O67_15000 [Vicinamibacterales bacterium]